MSGKLDGAAWCIPLGSFTWKPICWRAAVSHTKRFCSLNRAACLHAVSPIPVLPPSARVVHTPLRVDAWAMLLSDHPNQVLVQSLLDGLSLGVRIGFNPSASCRSAARNMPSALAHPDVVQTYLEAELVAGNVAGPFDPAILEGVVVNRFGVIPKANKPGKWRLIVDLSHPPDSSVNDGISSADASMSYSRIDDAAHLIVNAGHGAFVAKIDIANTFRIIPMHPDDRYILGMQWQGKVYIDTQLPFGLRSAPMLFNAYADALERILHNEGISRVIHYLDDFLVVGSSADECESFLSCMLRICDMLGVPLAADKIEGPSTELTFLGIRLNTVTMEACLPDDKLTRLQSELCEWHQRKKYCTRKELEHLLGVLQFACNVVPQGRPFVRRLTNLLCIGVKPFHHIRLNKESRSDILWWSIFVQRWNGISLLNLSHLATPSAHVFSDASGTWGCGAVWDTLWLQGSWPLSWAAQNIMLKELVPVVLAAALWGKHWSGQLVQFHVDNMSVVQVVNKGSSKEPSGIAMHL